MNFKKNFFVIFTLLCSFPQLQGMETYQEPNLGLNQTYRKRADKMMLAIRNNDVQTVKSYIEKGYPVYFINEQSVSALGLAAFNAHAQIVQAILEAYPVDQEKKANPNHFSFFKTVHEFTLVTPQSTNVEKKIPRTDFGYAPLHWACGNPATKHRENDILHVVQLLLEHGANPSYSVSDFGGFFYGTTPIEPEKAIDLAYAQGLYQVAAILKKAERKKFKKEEREMPELFKKGLEDFFENGPKEGEKEKKPTINYEQLQKLAKELFVAAKIGNVIRVKKLLALDIPAYYVNKFDWLTPLSVAANNGNDKVVKVLLKHNVDPNFQYIPEGSIMGGPTALHALCRNNNLGTHVRIKIASLLLAYGARTDLPGFDPRIITRHDRKSPDYNHLVDLIENCPELTQIFKKK